MRLIKPSPNISIASLKTQLGALHYGPETMLSWLALAIRIGQRSDLMKMPRELVHSPAGQEKVPETFRVDSLAGHELFEVTIQQLQEHFKKGHFTSVEYVKYCLSRIRALDSYIETVIETNPEAEQIAAALDNERARGSVRGPLHGLPVLVKDNIGTKDKMQTTAGSWALLGSEVTRDAHIVSKLRDAGAIILGHANMGEWASVRSKVYSTGYSPRKGQVRNPFDLRKSPFGSSSGSAAAVSANIVPLSIGTETDTSIIGPAGINGVVGIKPTVGLTSRSGVVPISENMDSVGTFGRTVVDATFGLSAIVGPDQRDQFTQSLSRKQVNDYSQFIVGKEVLKGARFGLPIKRCWELAPLHCKEVALRVFDTMKDAGAEIVNVDFPSIEERIGPEGTWNWEHGEPSKSEWTVAKVDAYNGINRYLRDLSNTPIKTVEDVLTYNQQNEGTEGPVPGKVPAFPSGQVCYR
jgi:amidase